MTYLVFLLVFIVPPVLVLALTQPRPLAGLGGARARYALPLVCMIAFAYTTPWDNYLVYAQVWGYGADRVVGTVGYVPVEEYLFFLLQPLLAGLVLYRFLARGPGPVEATTMYRSFQSFFWLAITGIGAGLLLAGPPQARYLGLILAWAAPVLFGMQRFAGPFFRRYRRPMRLAVALPTLYLWIADRLAIGLGIWDISDRYSLGFDPLGLPVEEAVFFLLTNLLVVNGTMLFLFGDRIARARAATPKRVAGWRDVRRTNDDRPRPT